MLCPQCQCEVAQRDFLGKKICYKCLYKEKMEKYGNVRRCKICKKLLDNNRWAYCSEPCQAQGKAKHKKEYWVYF